jgi:hypothetical protein
VTQWWSFSGALILLKLVDITSQPETEHIISSEPGKGFSVFILRGCSEGLDPADSLEVSDQLAHDL